MGHGGLPGVRAAGSRHLEYPGRPLISLSVAVYAIAFSVVGNDFNQYWGCQIAPLLCLTAARAPFVLRHAWLAAFERSDLAT